MAETIQPQTTLTGNEFVQALENGKETKIQVLNITNKAVQEAIDIAERDAIAYAIALS